ncbi:MAG: Gfo/Idh/MocA family protein [Planctomycetota bacterium]
MERLGNSQPLSLGFIGGSIDSAVGYTHLVSSTLDNRWSVPAGCFSTDPATNHQTARRYGVGSDRVYSSWPEMLVEERDRLDAVAVMTPTPSHGNIVKACLRAGYAVICEKALATHKSEAVAIAGIRDRTHGFLAVVYNYSGYPMVRELRRRIARGDLGKMLHFHVEMPQEGHIRTEVDGKRPKPQGWRLIDGCIPTVYLDLGVHLHQLSHYLLRESPLEVIADQESFGWFPEVIDNVQCLCRYSTGIQGHYWFGKSAIGHRNGLRLRVYGSQGSAEWCQAYPEDLILCYSNGRKEILDRASSVSVASARRYNRFKPGHPDGFIEAFANLYHDIADCLRDHQADKQWSSDEVFGVDLAIEGLSFFEAMVDSIRTRSWQSVSREMGQTLCREELYEKLH